MTRSLTEQVKQGTKIKWFWITCIIVSTVWWISCEGTMKKLPRTEDPLVIRTDFSDAATWEAICKAIQEPSAEDGFLAYVEFLDDPKYSGITPDQLYGLFPNYYDHSFIFLVDHVTLINPDYPILVVNLHEEDPPSSFRVIPSEMWAVQNNLSSGNMGFEEFADSVDQDGVYRGSPRP